MNRYIGSCVLALALGMTSGATLADTSATSASPAQVARTAPPAVAPIREVILVRHGHYLADPSIDERVGPGLSTLGFAQARLVGARLRTEYPDLDGRHVSPMQRARDTASAIALDLDGGPFAVVEDLAECTPPTWREDVMSEEEPESTAACKAQLDRLFERVFVAAGTGARTDLYVCHGNVIRYLVTRALGVDTEAWLEMSVGHTSLTRIRIEGNGRYKVIAVGDVGHLPSGLRTGAAGDPERALVPAGR